MSTRASLREWLGQVPPAGERECAICGSSNWSAMWVGSTELHVCAVCAVEILPRLIADAIWHHALTPTQAESIVVKVRGEFWRAIAINALRTGGGSAYREP